MHSSEAPHPAANTLHTQPHCTCNPGGGRADGASGKAVGQALSIYKAPIVESAAPALWKGWRAPGGPRMDAYYSLRSAFWLGSGRPPAAAATCALGVPAAPAPPAQAPHRQRGGALTGSPAPQSARAGLAPAAAAAVRLTPAPGHRPRRQPRCARASPCAAGARRPGRRGACQRTLT